jgi:hypothetical protein
MKERRKSISAKEAQFLVFIFKSGYTGCRRLSMPHLGKPVDTRSDTDKMAASPTTRCGPWIGFL